MSNAHWSQLQGDRNKSYFRPGGAEVVQADPGRVLCFAYGSALTPAFRESRGVNSLQIIPGRVSNFKLMFQHQGGYGTIDYRPNDTARPDVHGVVLEISSQDMERLGDREQGYMVQDVAVLAETGDLYISKAFMSHISWRLPQEVRPPAEYLNSLQQGARLHNLPMEYQNGDAWRRLQRYPLKDLPYEPVITPGVAPENSYGWAGRPRTAAIATATRWTASYRLCNQCNWSPSDSGLWGVATTGAIVEGWDRLNCESSFDSLELSV